MPSIYVTRFFQLVTARRFAEAERVLLRLRQKISTTEWNTGYFQALRGMLLAQNFKNKDEMQGYRREFLRHARNKLHGDYDRGYFAAWASYMRVLAKLEFAADKPKSKSPKKKEIKAKAKAEKKVTEETKEKTEVKRREETEKEIKAETEKREIEKPGMTESIEPRQRTLFEFSK